METDVTRPGNSRLRTPFDVVFLSYDEPNCEENWTRVQDFFPGAQRVHGIEGISRAHAECSRRARTENFFLIDGDAEVLEDANLDHSTFTDLYGRVYLWRSLNPVNGIVSGFGGIKLAHRSAMPNGFPGVDMTTSVDKEFVRVSSIASISRFNASPFTAWRAAFRECAKISGRALADSDSAERQLRLETWCTVGADKPFGEPCLRGARAGRAFGARHAGDDSSLELINDYRALRQLFEEDGRTSRRA